MLNITCTFDKAELQKIYKNLNKVERVAKGLIRTIPEQASREFAELVKNEIINGRAYAKYSPSYKAWKDKHGFGSKFWKLMGDLERATGSYKISETTNSCSFLGGVKSGIFDSGSKGWGLTGPSKEMSKYGRWMEFGRRGQPARPLFGPVSRKYYRTGYGALVNRFYGKVKSAWV